VALEYMRPIAEFRNIAYALLLVVVIMVASRGIWGSLAAYFKK
jgi:hypothetical protein